MLLSVRASPYRSFNGEPSFPPGYRGGSKNWFMVGSQGRTGLIGALREEVRTLSMDSFNLADVQLSSQIKTIIENHVYGKCEIQITLQ